MLSCETRTLMVLYNLCVSAPVEQLCEKHCLYQPEVLRYSIHSRKLSVRALPLRHACFPAAGTWC
jgi:hypothetical protein